MAYAVSSDFTNQIYSGESNYRAILTIGENTIDNDQIASISISSPIIDESNKVFYLGTFISQKITIKFKNMDNIFVESGENVDLSIGQYVNNEWVDIPIGKFLIDDLAEDYHEKCELTCLDYAVKFKPNIDYSECFVDGKATISTILNYICTACGVELGYYPTINDNVEVGTYDSTVSGKQWISYIAEIKGCNAKIDRSGKLTLQPLKQPSKVPINALESSSFDVGEKVKFTQVTFYDAIRNYTVGDIEGDTLFIRQDNPFVNDINVIQNIYTTICADKNSETGTEFEVEDADATLFTVNTIYGDTEQDSLSGKNKLNVPSSYSTTLYDDIDLNIPAGTYTVGASNITTNATSNALLLQFKKIDDTIQNSYIYFTDKKATFTFDNTIKKVRIYAGGNYNQSVDKTTTFTNLMLVSGNTLGDYEQYCGGIPSPNPDFPQQVNTVTGGNIVNITGKNTFKNNPITIIHDGITMINDGTNISFSGNNTGSHYPSFTFYANGDVVDNNWWVGTSNIKKENGYFTDGQANYILSLFKDGDIITANNIMCYIGRETTVDSFTITNETDNYTKTINSNSEKINFISIGFREHQEVDLSFNIQLEKGSIATNYEPYQNQSYEINLGKNLFDNTYNDLGMYQTATGRIGTFAQGSQYLGAYCKVEAGKTYSISKSKLTSRFAVGTTKEIPTANTQCLALARNDSVNKIENITIPEGYSYLVLYLSNSSETSTGLNLQIEQGNRATSYKPYFEPIELCKIGNYQDYIRKSTGKNLFDKDNANILNAYFNLVSGYNKINISNSTRTIYIPCKANTTYTISKISSARFYVGYTNELPAENVIVYGIDGDTEGYTSHTITTGTNAKYLCAFVYHSSYDTTITIQQILNTIQIEENSQATDLEPYGVGKWYLHKEIGKVVLDGNTDFKTINVSVSSGNSNMVYVYTTLLDNLLKTNLGFNNSLTRSEFHLITNTNTNTEMFSLSEEWAGLRFYFNKTRLSSVNVAGFTSWIGDNNQTIYYVLATSTNTEITYQPLLDQLNALQSNSLFEGINYITVDSNNLIPQVNLDYYTNSNFGLYSIKTHNYGDFTLDAWDNIEYSLGEDSFVTLNNNTLTYEMTIMGDVNTKIPTTQQVATTNIIGGDDKVNIKKIKTEVDNLNASVNILATQQTNTESNLTQLQIDLNGINQQVEHIENDELGNIQSQLSSVTQTANSIANMFQITGGINIIRNSAFLLTDDVWNFTTGGTNPYYTELGKSYNSALSGSTTSVAEIKLRNVTVKSKTDNITNLKIDGTKYTFNFYHKQDANMTTTIKMYATENNTAKAFNDIVITGQQAFKNYEASFIPTQYANYTIEIVVTSTASVGYSYIYDMMLNAGDKQSWQPSSDEIYSTTLQMSRLGLQVYSSGDGTLTLLGSDGLLTYETADGVTKGALISKRTADGDITRNITTQSVRLTSDITRENVDKWVETTLTLNNKLYKVEYIESGGQ